MTAQHDVFTPATLGPVTLRNRIIKAATFEASTPNALVTDDLITYHRLPAAGGVGMTTVAYLATSPDLYGPICRNIESHGGLTPKSRVVLEKPIVFSTASSEVRSRTACAIDRKSVV